ncbi:excisionase family DNA-binding protein [Synechocystis sp. PCC 7509]|uniref:excisionase family DNA-binding protein n=1 Tax=Synechocystis sp. PCC 7509 TaxID=927677 RepID=UPI0002ABE177|nr:helix-turn-helix domain-containing protein [Synechocystis sp. PCC 7509]
MTELIFATEKEVESIQHLDSILSSAISPAKLVGTDGKEIFIPDAVYSVMRQAIHIMASGQAVSLVPLDCELTLQQAADILNVSSSFLLGLLEQEEIPYIKAGSHQRIQFKDLMAYKQQRGLERRQSLQELTQLSQGEGFYN